MAAADEMLYDVKRVAHDGGSPGSSVKEGTRSTRSAASALGVLFKSVKSPRPHWPSDRHNR